MVLDPTRTPGSFGAAPDHAPQEVTLPGSERATPDQIRQARANEQDLPAYAPQAMSIEQMASFLGKPVEEIQRLRGGLVQPATPVAPVPVPLPPATIVDVHGRPMISSTKPVDAPLPSKTATGLRRPGGQRPPAPSVELPVDSSVDTSPVTSETVPPEVLVVQVDTAPSARTDSVTDLASAAAAQHPRTINEHEPYRPAASNTDSPSRGVPTPVADPAKKITGGFGDLGEAQYFPLTGIEAGAVVIAQLEELISRVKDDLRFSIAATYPRVAIRTTIEVECFAADHGFQIKKITAPHHKTPIDIARERADECCFVLREQHVEMTDAGESVTPPNAARLAHGLEIPRKQAVETPGGRMIVDLVVR